MKTKLTAILVILMMSVGMFAQGQGNQYPSEPKILKVIPDLSQDQQEKIKEYHTEMIKTITPLKAELQAKQAELDVLMTKDSDLKEKEAIVKEIGDIKYNMQMARIEYHDKVRSLLNDDQKAVYDNMYLNHKKKGHHPMQGKPGHGPMKQKNCKQMR